MAVQIFLGVGISSFPTRLPEALADYVGPDRAVALRPRVEALVAEACLEPQDWGTADLREATQQIEDKMRSAHPELSDDAVKALGWSFSYTSR
jgi:hypothetical protein